MTPMKAGHRVPALPARSSLPARPLTPPTPPILMFMNLKLPGLHGRVKSRVPISWRPWFPMDIPMVLFSEHSPPLVSSKSALLMWIPPPVLLVDPPPLLLFFVPLLLLLPPLVLLRGRLVLLLSRAVIMETLQVLTRLPPPTLLPSTQFLKLELFPCRFAQPTQEARLPWLTPLLPPTLFGKQSLAFGIPKMQTLSLELQLFVSLAIRSPTQCVAGVLPKLNTPMLLPPLYRNAFVPA